MATKTLTQIFNEVAQAIQEKKGSSTPISAEDFGTEIANLPSGGGADVDVLTIPYNSTIVIHLDKLKKYLPTEILNTQLTYYNYYGEQYYLGIQVGEDIVGPISVRFSQVVNDASSYYSANASEIETGDINTETNILSSVKLFQVSGETGAEIPNISISNPMTVSDLIDSIITANGSNNVFCSYDYSAWGNEDIISISSLNVIVYGNDPSDYTKCIASNKFIPNSQLKEIFTISEE